MKLNKIFMALAAVAMVGCSSEDLSDFGASQNLAPEDSRLVQLDPNFVIAGVGVEGNTTRTHWEMVTGSGLVNKFLPIYNASAGLGTQLDQAVYLEEQAVGLCWLGNGAVGTDVYTNYEFYHFGWLNEDEDNAEFECGALSNGALYSDLDLIAAGTANEEADETNFNYTAASGKTGTPSDDLNFNSGVYKTENKAIFGGQYIVYYPYNEDFKDAGTIPAEAVTEFGDATTDAPTKLIDAALGKATFRYSAPVEIEGGAQHQTSASTTSLHWFSCA